MVTYSHMSQGYFTGDTLRCSWIMKEDMEKAGGFSGAPQTQGMKLRTKQKEDYFNTSTLFIF